MALLKLQHLKGLRVFDIIPKPNAAYLNYKPTPDSMADFAFSRLRSGQHQWVEKSAKQQKTQEPGGVQLDSSDDELLSKQRRECIDLS